jgi:hypothetical protein
LVDDDDDVVVGVEAVVVVVVEIAGLVKMSDVLQVFPMLELNVEFCSLIVCHI